MDLMLLRKRGLNVALLTVDVSEGTMRTAMAVAERLGFALSPVKRPIDPDRSFAPHNCMILVEGAGWSDDDLAELALCLTLNSSPHGGIILSGSASGAAARQLAAVGLLRQVSFPLNAGELTAALVAGLEAISKNNLPAAADMGAERLSASSRTNGGNSDDLRQLLHSISVRRHARRGPFPEGLFSDPAWDILISLAKARLEGRSTQVSNLGVEAGIPPSTALRRVKELESAGLVERWGDPNDRRRDFVRLSDLGLEAFRQYCANIIAREVSATIA